MNLAKWLHHTCIIKRTSATTEDPFGNAQVSEEQIVYRGKCRLIDKNEQVVSDLNARPNVTFITHYTLLLPPEAPVLERDRISSIELETGEVIADGFDVSNVITRRFLYRAHHKILALKRVT